VTLAVASLALAIDAAADAAQSLGYQPLVLARSLDGEAREVGRMVASIVVDATSGAGLLPPGGCLIAGGETVVTVRGNGTGGRNTEAALAAALRLSGTAGVAVGFLATDGDDGTTGAAGAIVGGATLAADELRDAREALARNDSYPLLARAGAALRTGPSGTNVNDLIVALREREG
jgi:glycerate-2-kinase